ncbi:MAG: AarF/ABC1/UbiB kinase family protein [Candidatus Alcyoniella australis]|nr:AarF/ABC1/UbiB kinase family protein [Candidatus Alcyoniella australis]
MASEKKVHTTRGGRFFKLGGLSARVGSSYLGERIKDTFLSQDKRRDSLSKAHTRNAQRVVETFGELKGAAMKLGQQISLAADILPPEITQVLSQLQRTAPPVPFSQLREQFLSELGREPEELFQSIDQTAHASASIGQVHRAVLKDGREVVVKIQYPNVDQMVESDLSNLRSLVRTIGRAWFKADVDKFFEEVRELITEELDYEIESYNLKLFRKLLRDRDDVLIPEPLDDYSSQRVLTMTYLEGRSWDELCSDRVDQSLRNELAARLFELLLHQVFDLHVLHADPHPGNYALDSRNRLVIYDFGCIKKFPAQFVQAYQQTLSDGFHRRFERLPEDCDNLGIRVLDDDRPDPQIYRQACEIGLEPFGRDAPYPMHLSDVHEKMQQWGTENYMMMRKFDAPPNIIMLNRVIGGMYGNFRRLRAEANWHAILEPYCRSVD